MRINICFLTHDDERGEKRDEKIKSIRMYLYVHKLHKQTDE
jgi:hypothetical protein